MYIKTKNSLEELRRIKDLLISEALKKKQTGILKLISLGESCEAQSISRMGGGGATEGSGTVTMEYFKFFGYGSNCYL